MDNSQRFASTIQGIDSIGAPSSNPMGAAYSGLYQNLLKSSFQMPLAGAAASGMNADQSIKVANAEAAAEEARAARVAALKEKQQKLKDALEGKNYQVVKKDDGGFDYYDPLGQKINLMQYSRATGKNAADVLKDSQNSLDRQFVADYNNLQDLTNAYLNKDWKKVDKVGQTLGMKNPGDLRKLLETNQVKPEDLFKQFVQYYPNVYTMQPGGETGRVRGGNEPVFQLPSPQRNKIFGIF